MKTKSQMDDSFVVDYDYRAVLGNWNECEKIVYICSSGRTEKGSKIVVIQFITRGNH